MNISIVIPNYNGEALLRKNLPKVFESVDYYIQKTKEQAEIIVVDDFSTDNSVSSIDYYASILNHKNISFRILLNKKNLGFSSTVNYGVSDSIGEIVILLNSDVIPEKDFLVPLIDHFKDDKVFAVGCMDKSIEGSKTILRGRGIGRWQRGFLVHSRGEVNKTNTLWVNGGSGAFRKSIWEKLGGFNKLYYPFYWEDIDISYRAQKAGYKVFFEPKSIVVHQHEKGAIKKKYSPFQIKTIAYKNQFIFVWLNITDSMYLISHFIWLPYYLLTSLKDKNFVFFLGLLKACLFLPKIFKLRLNQESLFVKTDRELLNQFSYEFDNKN